ncbi:MAG: macrolide ABC transporter permease/ATP-binding protein MacB, partial [Pseudohongiellaceae bacterium]
VAVARSVVGDPKLILADEPTGNLDTTNGDEVMAMLAKLKDKGVTIMMVTHSPEHGSRADRIIEMLDGEIVGGDAASTLSVVADNTSTKEHFASQD